MNDPVEEFLAEIEDWVSTWEKENPKNAVVARKGIALVRVYREELIKIDDEFCGSRKMSEPVGTLYVRLKRIRGAIRTVEEKAKEIIK